MTVDLTAYKVFNYALLIFLSQNYLLEMILFNQRQPISRLGGNFYGHTSNPIEIPRPVVSQ